MGNAAVKEFKEATLSEASIDEAKCISSTLVTSDTLLLLAKTKGLSKITKYETKEGKLYASAKSNMSGKKSTITDPDGNFIAFVKVKDGFSSSSTSIFRNIPSFEDQSPLPEKENEDGEALYLFSTIETKKKIKSATSTYSIVIGEEEGEPVLEAIYTGKTLPSLGFYVEVKTNDDVLIGKASTTGKFSATGQVEMASGVDILAVALVSQSVAPGGSAGALAGAGVV